MSRIPSIFKFSICLLVFLAAILFAPCNLAASENSLGTLKLSPQIDKKFSLAEHGYFISDPDAQYTLQDIIHQYNQNELQPYSQGTINLHRKSEPFWFVFSVENDTDLENWTIDFGSLNTRSGVFKNILIYGIEHHKIFYDGLRRTSRDTSNFINKTQIKINIPPQKKSSFIIYINPENYKKSHFSPFLSYSSHKEYNQSPFKDFIITHQNTVLALSIGLIFVAFVITTNIGFIPLMGFYLVNFLWFNFVESPLILPTIVSFINISILPIILSLCVAFTCLALAPLRFNNPYCRTILLIAIGINVLLSIAIFLVPGNVMNDYNIPQLAGMMCLFASILFLLTSNLPSLKISNLLLSFWIGMAIISEMSIFLASNGFISVSFHSIHANWIASYPMVILVLIGTILTIKNTQKHSLDMIVRKTRRAESLLNARKSKETTDHSRLLRVIEREREIMEELRGRESERTQEMRLAKIAADEANQAKSAFLAVVSHEIRTPMTGVMGMIRMLEDTNLDQTQQEYVMTIKDSGDAMVALLNDILDFSKFEGAGLQLEHIEFDPRRILNGVVMLMKGHADQKNIALNLKIDEKIPQKLHGDPTRLRQVFLNLVGNALKFTSKGHVAIHATLKSIDDDNNAIISFAVEDTGIGISKEGQKVLFTPFAQADNSIARKYGGTGLGLAICKTIIEAMGSDIKIASEEGRGTKFTFDITFEEAQETQNESNTAGINKSQTSGDISLSQSSRFLIVDDNDINLRVVSGFLKRENHNCVLAHGGQEAIKIIEKDNEFDAVFLDIEMPDMSGIDVAEKIKKLKKINEIPLIAMTGNIQKSDLDKYKNIGFQGHIAKPIDPESLNFVISRVLNGENGFYAIKNQPSDIEHAIKKDNALCHQPLGKTLDESMLNSLKDGIGIKQTLDLIDDLFIKTDEIIQQFKQCVTDKDINATKMRAHELRGMASNFGLKAISQKALEIELIAKDIERPITDIEPHIDDLETLVERTKIAIDTFFSQ